MPCILGAHVPQTWFPHFIYSPLKTLWKKIAQYSLCQNIHRDKNIQMFRNYYLYTVCTGNLPKSLMSVLESRQVLTSCPIEGQWEEGRLWQRECPKTLNQCFSFCICRFCCRHFPLYWTCDAYLPASIYTRASAYLVWHWEGSVFPKILTGMGKLSSYSRRLGL